MRRRAATIALGLIMLVAAACGPTVPDVGSGGGEGSTGTDATATASMSGSSASADGGGSCPPWLVACGEACVDTQSDPANCGACGTACGELVCASGACVRDCGRLTACGQSCVDLQTDAQHCGACDSPCASNELCSDSECDMFSPTSCTTCPCPECEDNCCAIGRVVVCAMGECPP